MFLDDLHVLADHLCSRRSNSRHPQFHRSGCHHSGVLVGVGISCCSRARRRRLMRARPAFNSIVVSSHAAHRSGSVSSIRKGRAGVAVCGMGVCRLPAQFGFVMRGWSGPPLGLQSQNAGQSEGEALRLHRMPLTLRPTREVQQQIASRVSCECLTARSDATSTSQLCYLCASVFTKRVGVSRRGVFETQRHRGAQRG